jgi:hypothetical protein
MDFIFGSAGCGVQKFTTTIAFMNGDPPSDTSNG